VEEIEILFNAINDLGGGALNECKSLRSLTLIDTALTNVGSHTLLPISHTLERLNLSQQGLTRMSGILSLPVLRELFLHENLLTRIEGLTGCPRLQRLWLHSNKIARMDNLHPLGELKELWLQCNKISRIGGLEGLGSLMNLGLGGNKIAEYKDLQRLSLLPSLKNVSFDDFHFGSCPVTRLDGYRNFALCYLKQVTHLDGLEVTGADRAAAEDAYMESVMKFNNRVEEVTREGGREALAIEARRARTKSHGDALKLEMVSAFDLLERLVKEGLLGVSNEHERQVRVRRQNQKSLENSLTALAKEFSDEVDKQLIAEAHKGKMEERAFALIEARTIAERDQAIMISNLQFNKGSGSGGGAGGGGGGGAGGGGAGGGGEKDESNKSTNDCIACQYIGDHLPDFQLMLSNFVDAQKLPTNSDAEKLTLLKVYRCFNTKLVADFERLNDGQEEKMLRLYVCCGIDDAVKVLSNGFVDGVGGYKDIVLFSDPLLATRLALNEEGALFSREGDKAEETGEGGIADGETTSSEALKEISDALGTNEDSIGVAEDVAAAAAASSGSRLDKKFAAFFVIQVRVALKLFSTIALDSIPTSMATINNMKSKIPKSADGLKITYPINDGRRMYSDEDGQSGSGSTKGQFYCVRPEKAAHVLPEHHMLCTGSQLKSEIKRLEKVLEEMKMLSVGEGQNLASVIVGGGGDSTSNKKLEQLENSVKDLVQRYSEAVWEELSPETADQLRELDKDMRHREKVVGRGREAIDLERENQENILREFRAALAQKGGGGRNSVDNIYGVGAGAMSNAGFNGIRNTNNF